jgi:Ca-activated chloride channel family protein
MNNPKEKRMKIVSFLLSVVFCVSMMIPGTGRAAESPGLLMILDASGSMWGKIDGQPKIGIAKKAASTTITALPDTISAGLILYGHRRKGDCRDIELVAPVGAGHAAILARLDGVNAKGKTPLASSLTQAGDLLAGREGESTILLVSDGIETCGGDPCAIVAAMKEKGIKLVVHVIGFDVRGEAVDQLKCIARAGDGSYFQADDTSALLQALQSVSAAVVEHKPPAPQPQPAIQAAAVPAAQTSASTRIRIAGPGKVVLEPASWVKMPPQHWSLVEAESGERGAEGSGLESSVKAGEYQVSWKQSEHGHTEVMLTETVQVQSGKTTKLAINTGLKPVIPSGMKPPYWWGLMPAEETLQPEIKYPDCIRFRDTLEPQVVPAGSYHLLWRQSEYFPTQNLGLVTIASGRLNEIAVDSGLVLQPADWVTQQPYFYALLDAQGKQVARWNVYGPQVTAPGKYTLVFRPTEHGHQDIIWQEITIANHGMVAVPINSGIRFIHAKEARAPYRFFLVDLASKKEIVVMENWDPLPLPPGRYRLDWQDSQHGSKRSTLADELTVEAGVLLEIEL